MSQSASSQPATSETIIQNPSQNGLSTNTEMTVEASNPPSNQSSPSHQMSDAPALKALKSALDVLLRNSLVEVMEALETLLVYTKNLIQYPEEKKYRKIKISNIHYQERLGHLDGAADAMSAIGYQPVGDYLRLDECKQNNEENEKVLKSIETIIQSELQNVKQGWNALPPRLDDSHSFQSVKGAGSFSAIGKRNHMEDDEIIVDGFCGDQSQGYFGLYDGHGGRATVDFVVKALHLNLEQHLKRNPEPASLCEAFKHSYLATDGQLRRQNILRSGTTSVTCVVRVDKQTNQRWLFTANVGDSRAVLCRGGKAVRLTIDHKASLPEEAKRITDAGGFIGRNKRVNGVLAISRALGDHMLKENDVVSAEPFTTDTQLTDEDTHVLLACDGVWDVMTDQEAIDFIQTKITQYSQEAEAFKDGDSSDVTMAPAETKADADGDMEMRPRNLNETLTRVSRDLVREALDRRSLDNVTVMIVAL